MKNSGTRSLIYTHCSALEREIYLPLRYKMSLVDCHSNQHFRNVFTFEDAPLWSGRQQTLGRTEYYDKNSRLKLG